MEAKGVAATAVTYSTAIAAMARGGDWAKALELLKSMAAKVGAAHTPNTAPLSLVSAAPRGGRLNYITIDL